MNWNKNIKPFILIFLVSAFCNVPFSLAAGPEAVLGPWYTDKKEARIEIYRCGTKYCGKIAWMKEPNYSADADSGVPGTPKLDQHNPVPELRKRTMLGLQILYGFEYAGDKHWKNGKIYNPDNGKMYSAKMTLIAPDQLKVRGFLGISLIGGSTVWTRAKPGSY